MSETYKTRGVVLNAIKHGETGHIVYMYTERYGRTTYYVNGNRAGRPVIGKNRIVLQPLTVIDMIGSTGLKGGMHRIREASNHFLAPNIIFDIKKSSIALFMAEVVYRIVREDAPNQAFFDFFIDSIVRLNSVDAGTANFHIYFLVRLTEFLGFKPVNSYFTGSFFDIRRGEFTPMKPQHTYFIDQQITNRFSAFLEVAPYELSGIAMNRSERVSLLNSLIDFIGYHHDAVYKVASVRILGEIF